MITHHPDLGDKRATQDSSRTYSESIARIKIDQHKLVCIQLRVKIAIRTNYTYRNAWQQFWYQKRCKTVHKLIAG